VLNIALEGQMLGGAFTAIVVQQATGNPALTLLAVAAFGAATSLVLSWGTFRLKADPFIAALGLNLLIPALTGWVSFLLFGNQGIIRLDQAFAPQLGTVPLSFAAALLLALGVQGLVFHTAWGLRLRAAGTSEALMASRGLRTGGLKTTALLLSGVLGALGGAVLALNLGTWVQGISAGKGWIALVALYLGLRKPLGLVLAVALLAFTEQLSGFLQGVPELPQGVLMGLPSLITVVVFVATSALQRRSSKPISR
jgi:simple sugar transport system permease protein